jgi:uncharacterized protein (DUF362 family)
MKGITRRNFLKYVGVGSLGFIARPLFPFIPKGRGRASDVIQCHDDNATTGLVINDSIVDIMMEESIKTLTGIGDVGEAWKSIFGGIDETKIIGIKVNAAWYPIPTHPQFVNSIINGLTQMNFGGNLFKRNNVVIWDRTDSELQDSGYMIYAGTDPDIVRCFGSSHAGVGYDSDTPLTVDYYPSGTVTKYPSNIMSVLCDYLINVSVLKNHSTSQVTLCLKNHFGSIDQPVGNPPHYNYCDPSIPSLNQQIRDVVRPPFKEKIFIIDSLFGSLLQGPVGNPDWNPKKLIMSLDPVACDYQGWNLINEERVASGYGEIPWPVYHIETATQDPYNLGTTDINLIEIFNPSGIEERKVRYPTLAELRIHPDPVQKKMVISFSLPYSSPVEIEAIDANGRIGDTVFSGNLPRGPHRVSYGLKGRFPNGIYFIRLRCCGMERVQKFSVLR